MEIPQQKFDAWCIVELFGHAKIAGKCTEQNIAGTNMLRVDIPETASLPAFTRFFGSAAIYAINPVDETTCKHVAGQLQVKPIEAWSISEVLKKYQEQNLLTAGNPAPSIDSDNEEEESEPDGDFDEYLEGLEEQ